MGKYERVLTLMLYKRRTVFDGL